MTRARENADLPVAMTESGGQVGIGTAAPAKSLDVNMASATMRIRDASGGNDFSVKTVAGPVSLAGSTVNTAIGFMTNDTERMRIDGSGRVTTPQPGFYKKNNWRGWKPTGVITEWHISGAGHSTLKPLQRINKHFHCTCGR